MKVWISRNKKVHAKDIFFWESKPKKIETENKSQIEYHIRDGSLLGHFEQPYLFQRSISFLGDFEKEFGFIPEPGSCEEIELKIERTKK